MKKKKIKSKNTSKLNKKIREHFLILGFIGTTNHLIGMDNLAYNQLNHHDFSHQYREAFFKIGLTKNINKTQSSNSMIDINYEINSKKLSNKQQVVAHKVTDKKIIKKDKNRHSFINQKR